MSDIDPKIAEMLEKVGLTAGDLSKSMENLRARNDGTVKSLTRQAMELAAAHKARIAAAEKEVKAMGLTGAAMKAEAKARAELQKTLEDQADEEEASIKRSQDLDKKREDGVKKLIDGFKNIGQGLLTSASAFYNSKDVFTSVIPTLDLMGNTIKTTIDAVALMTSGIEILGFSLGRASEGVAKLAGAAIDMTLSVAKMKLEFAQSYLNSSQTLAKAGVTFGGNLDIMTRSAHDAGMNLQLYGEFVKKNIDNLSAMGGTLEQASIRIGKMSQAALKGNDRLLMMYGGYEGVNDALAIHGKLLAQQGVDTVKDQAKIQAGAGNYLKTLKELQEITGLSVEAQAKVQEEAQRDLAWRMKLADLRASGQDAKADALEMNYKLALTMKGPAIAKMYQEVEVNNGRVISSTNTLLAAQSKGSIDYARGMMETSNLVGEERKKALLNVNTAADERLGYERRVNTNLVKILQYSGEGEAYAKNMMENYKGQLDTVSKSKSLEIAMEKVAQDAKRDIGAASKGSADLIRQNNESKKDFDKYIAGAMPKMAAVAAELTKLQKNMIDLFGGDEKFTSAVLAATKALNKLAGVSMTGDDKGPGTTSHRGGPVMTTGVGTKATYSAAEIAEAQKALNDPTVSERDKKFYREIVKNSAGASTPVTPAAPAPVAPTSSTARPPPPQGGGDETRSGGTDTAGSNLAKVSSKSGKSASVNKKYQGQFQGIIDWLDAQGYNISSLGGYNDRDVTGQPGVKSVHAFGGAIDINPASNPFTKGKLVTDMPAGIAQAAASLGLGWGGNWSNVKDAMHFSVAQNEGGKVKMYKNGGITDGTSIAGEDGPEAVIPLPDGRTVPVRMDASSLIEKLDELLSVMKDNRDYSEKISRSVA